MKLNETDVPLNPVISVTNELKSDIMFILTKQLKKATTVISTKDIRTLKRQRRRHSITATSSISLNTMEMFDTEIEQDHEAEAQAENLLKIWKS